MNKWFFKAVGQSTLARVASVGILLATSVVMARVLGPDGYGSYTFAFSLISLAVLVAQLGFPELTVREVSRQLALGRWRLLASYLRHADTTIIFVSCLIVIAIAALFYLVGSSGIASWRVMLVGLPLVFLFPLMAQAAGVIRGAGRVVQSVLGQQLYRPGIFLFLLAVFLIFGLPVNPVTAMALQGLASLLVLLEMRYRSRLVLPELGKPVVVRSPRKMLWFSSALMLSGVAVVQLINFKFDAIALGFLTDDEQVGLYAVGVQLSQAAAAVLFITAVVVAPSLAKTSAIGDDYRAERLCRQSALLSLAGSLGALAGAFLAGEWFISVVFGSEYVSVFPALMILLLGQSINAFFGPVGILLNMRGEERSTLKLTSIASLTNIALNLTLIPRYGLVGAALATAFSMVMWNVLLWLYAWKLWRINTSAIPYSIQNPNEATMDDANSATVYPRSK